MPAGMGFCVFDMGNRNKRGKSVKAFTAQHHTLGYAK